MWPESPCLGCEEALLLRSFRPRKNRLAPSRRLAAPQTGFQFHDAASVRQEDGKGL